MLSNGQGEGPLEYERMMLAIEGPRSTGVEEDCEGGQCPYQTVAPD